ncbi:MAG: RsmE family RNA methyltransferase [Pseudobacteriovorax sp.]|nr:RsmE family RNA methyltransferase [Pseudobacteriovorax sp.]
MGHRYRFFADYDKQNNRWTLHGQELKHLKKVLRLSSSDIIEVFDGRGYSAEAAAVFSSDGSSLEGEFITGFTKEPERRLRLALGALETSDFEAIIPGLIELGVTDILVFLQDGVEKKRVSQKNQDRWERIAVSACKQSKRDWLPRFSVFKRLEGLDEILQEGMEKIVLDGEGTPLAQRKIHSQDVIYAVGSEKGLGPSELEFLSSRGFSPSSIGPYVLRARTAAVGGAAVIASMKK